MPPVHPLTSLRFFAAAMIVVFHIGAWGRGQFGYGFIEELASGVSFFFVLSGFILTYAHANRPFDHFNFYVHRLARLWPMHLLTFLFVFLFTGAATARALGGYAGIGTLLNVLLLQGWIPIKPISSAYNGVSWSISAEMFFYLCFPLFVGRRWPIWLAAVLVVSLAAVWLVASRTVSWQDPQFVMHWSEFLYKGPLSRVPEFILGVLTAKLFLALPRPRLDAMTATVLEVGSIGAVVLVLVFRNHFIFLLPVNPGITYWLRFTFAAPAAALMIFVFAYSSGHISRLLSLRLFTMLGEASFSLYMIHSLIIAGIWNSGFVARYGQPVSVATVMVTAVLASLAIWAAFEVPARRFVISQAGTWRQNWRERGRAAQARRLSPLGDALKPEFTASRALAPHDDALLVHPAVAPGEPAAERGSA